MGIVEIEKRLKDLVQKQTDLFNRDAPVAEKMAVLSEIQKCQDERKRLS